MIVGNAVHQTVRQLGRNPLRSGLTTLGILIGVAAVIAMIALGRGAGAQVSSELSGLGQNLLFVAPGAPHSGGPGGRGVVRRLAVGDAQAIEREVRGVAAVAPTVSTSAVVVYGNASRRVNGRAFSDAEVRAGAPVCLLGATVRRALFGSVDPVGAIIRIDDLSVRVTGTLRSKGSSSFGMDQDDLVLVPLTTHERRLTGLTDVDIVFLSGAEGADTARIRDDVEALMVARRRIHEGEEPDFTVRDMKEIAAMVGSVTGVLSALLAAIAAISLVVGGIGIMNIMLVAVSERTREIGIRLAIGARGRDVLAQFLIEAVMLSALGGVAGIGLGLGASWLATSKLGIPMVIDATLLGLPFGFAAAVGVLFGFWPARKAARMNPIDALRHE